MINLRFFLRFFVTRTPGLSCVRVSWSVTLYAVAKQIELVFGTEADTKHSYFVSDKSPDPPTENKTFPPPGKKSKNSYPNP